MIAIKRKCKFFDSCLFVDSTSKTCTDGGGNYCGIYRGLKKTEEENGRNQKRKKLKKKTLEISHWDEFWGPVYTCPFCGEQKLCDDFTFCPICGRSLKCFVFEKEEEEKKRINKKKT